MDTLPKYIQRRGKRFRVVFPKHIHKQRFYGSYDTVQQAVAARDEKLEELNIPPPEDEGDRQEVGRDEWANSCVVYAKGGDIKTVEGLLEAAEIDLDEWVVQRSQINKWAVGAKAKKADLKWTDGRIDGSLEERGLVIAPLWQVKVWLIRREPVAVRPVIQPVECGYTAREALLPEKGLTRAMFVGDAQMGYKRDAADGRLVEFHDRRVLDLALQVAFAAGVDLVYFGGDLLDMTDWTDRFVREPAFYQTTQPAICEAHWWLRQFREAGMGVQVMEGNHEKRMRTAMMAHLPAAYDLKPADMDVPPSMSVRSLLQLDELGVGWVGGYPDELQWLNDEFAVCHGDVAQKAPGSTARATLDDKRAKVVFFHAHRIEMASMVWRTSSGPMAAFAFCPGCACHVDGRVPGSKKGCNWTQGFAIVDYDDRMASVQAIPVEDGRAVWDRMVFEGRDRIEDLQRDLPRWKWATDS